MERNPLNNRREKLGMAGRVEESNPRLSPMGDPQFETESKYLLTHPVRELGQCRSAHSIKKFLVHIELSLESLVRP